MAEKTNPTKTDVVDTDHHGDVKAGDFTQDLQVESGAIAIVDAAVLDGVDSPLARKALVVPIKWDGTFTVTGKFGDAILDSIVIKPKKDQLGDVAGKVPVDDTKAEVVPAEAAVPGSLSHDDSIHRRMREASGSKPTRDHMRGKQRHMPNPGSRIIPRRKRGTLQKRTAATESVQRVYDFVAKTNKAMQVTAEDLESVDKELLGNIVDKLYAITLHGWSIVEGVPTHTTGVTVNPNVWIVKDDLLYGIDDKRPQINFEWVFMVRQILKEHQLSRNVNMLEEFMTNVRPIFG